MTTLIIRAILFLTPLIVLFLFLRWRKAKAKDGVDMKAETAKLRNGLLITLLILIGAVFALRLTDTSTGDPGDQYTPPRIEDGKIVPGSYDKKDKGDKSDEDKDG